MVAGVLLSRLAYYAAGVRFDATPLRDFVQYIDPELLRHDLLSSVWHLHYQPPLYNLYLGAVLKLAGAHAVTAFHATYVLAGIVLALAIYDLVGRLGVPGRWSAAAAILFAASPPVVLYENWLYVEYLVAAALVAAIACIVRFADGGRGRWALAGFALLAAIVLSRSSFHVVWLVAVVAAIAWLTRRPREVLLAAALPVVLCLAVYAKDAGHGCTGVSLSHVSTDQLDPAERQRLVADGKLSPYALRNPFMLSRQELGRGAPTGVPLLDRPVKSTGAANFNAKAYDSVCAAYARDARTVIRTHPGAYAKGVETAGLIYMRPSSDYVYLQRSIHKFERAFAFVALGQFHRARPGTGSVASIGWFVVLGYAIALVSALALLRRERSVLAAVFLITFVWLTVGGNLVDAGENNRFRLALDPLAWILLVAWATHWIERRRRTGALLPQGARSKCQPRCGGRGPFAPHFM